METLLERFAKSTQNSQIISELKQLILKTTKLKKITIGLSGGSDSLFLALTTLSLYKEVKGNTNNILLIHCNHKTRLESDTEQENIRKKFSDQNIVIEQYKGKLKNEESLRKRRYSILEKNSQKFGSKFIMLGHHADDRIETAILNLTRGCGSNGLINMTELDTNGQSKTPLFRPLLKIRKKTLEEILKKSKISYFIDKTNFKKEISLRNLIRNDFIIEADKIGNGKFSDSILTIIEELTGKTSKTKKTKKLGIFPRRNLSKMIEIPNKLTENDIQNIFKKNLPSCAIDKLSIKKIQEIVSRNNSKHFRKNWGLIKTYNKTYLFEGDVNFTKKNFTKEIKINKLGDIKYGTINIEIKNKALIGKTLRMPTNGDKYGKKSWSKYCINKKIPFFLRGNIPVITEGNKIIQYFIDETINYFNNKKQ